MRLQTYADGFKKFLDHKLRCIHTQETIMEREKLQS